MLNYPVDSAVLEKYLPTGTSLDGYKGKTYVSIVGFLFLDAKVCGLGIPFHRNFEEVNLRFYVRRLRHDGWHRGVVFIKEIVPRLAIASTARLLYNEQYVALPMRHEVQVPSPGAERVAAEYAWEFQGRWNSMRVEGVGQPQEPKGGALQEFITEHYFGYTRQADGTTLEYRVEHPKWRVWPAAYASLEGDIAGLYGNEFVPFLNVKPTTAFLAEGSAVTVYGGTRID
jgi:uncharacterized protein YqjF (DUF2071 family)